MSAWDPSGFEDAKVSPRFEGDPDVFQEYLRDIAQSKYNFQFMMFEMQGGTGFGNIGFGGTVGGFAYASFSGGRMRQLCLWTIDEWISRRQFAGEQGTLAGSLTAKASLDINRLPSRRTLR